MSKELEVLERAKMEHSIIKQGFPEQEYIKTLDTIEKSLKALEIIKSKGIDMDIFIWSNNCGEYNINEKVGISYTQEEYDLLREVML